MKNSVKFFRIIALIVLTGFSIAACATNSSTSGTAAISTSSSAAGKGTITITGLDDYNGLYAYAAGIIGETYLIAAYDVIDVMGEELPTGGLIENGSITLPVWETAHIWDDENSKNIIEKKPFMGSVDGSFPLIIWDGEEILNRWSEVYYNGNIYLVSSLAVFGEEAPESNER